MSKKKLPYCQDCGLIYSDNDLPCNHKEEEKEEYYDYGKKEDDDKKEEECHKCGERRSLCDCFSCDGCWKRVVSEDKCPYSKDDHEAPPYAHCRACCRLVGCDRKRGLIPREGPEPMKRSSNPWK
jgi:hypothetical protein